MPVAVKVSELKCGMAVARPVRNRYTVLVATGKKIEPNDIARLEKIMPGGTIWIRDPVLDAMLEFDDLSHDQEIAAQMNSIVFNQVKKIQDKLSAKIALKGPEILDLHRSIRGAVDFLSSCSVSSTYLPRGEPKNYLETHQMNVFFLSMLIGREIKQYMATERKEASSATLLTGPETMVHLGMSAILHDAGLVPLAGVFEKNSLLSDEARKLIMEHTNSGPDLLGPSIPPLVRMTIKQHHENIKGKGYPKGLKGSQQHVLARIVRVADAFEACTATEVFPEAHTHARTLYELTMGRYKKFYDPTILKILQSLIVPFEPGSRVKLSTGTYAIVVKNRPLDPFRPIVQVLFNASGKRIPKESLEPPVDLAQKPIRLARVKNESLAYLYKPDYGEAFGIATGISRRLFNYFFP